MNCLRFLYYKCLYYREMIAHEPPSDLNHECALLAVCTNPRAKNTSVVYISFQEDENKLILKIKTWIGGFSYATKKQDKTGFDHRNISKSLSSQQHMFLHKCTGRMDHVPGGINIFMLSW